MRGERLTIRCFGSTGRFMSPDWSSDPDPVPYADFTNPQSLNLYGYVDNNPLSYFDPTGHENQGCNTSAATSDNSGVITVTVSCPQLPPQTFDLCKRRITFKFQLWSPS
jgi:hypothetical protein